MGYNSVIIRKHCICKECQDNPEKAKWPTFGCFSYFYAHLPEHLAKKAGTKRKVQIKNRNKRIAIAHKLRKEQKELDGGNDQEIWYLLRKHEMTGICSEEGCTNSTHKYNNDYYRWSVCHIVPKSPKSGVPSVATHEHNWIELCWIHHQELDASFERAKKMKCFPEAKRKFELFKELIPPEQMRKVNPYLFQTEPGNPTRHAQ